MSTKLLRVFFVVAGVLAAFIVSLALMRIVYPRKYSQLVSQYAEEYGLSENLVYAIIKCESNFRPDSVSHAGAIGLMQITPDTMQWAVMKEGNTCADTDTLYDENTNIKYGCCIYSLFFEEFGDMSVSLAAYNAGRGNVLKWLADKKYSEDGILLKNVPFSETAKYIKKVTAVKRIYELIY